MGLDGFIRLMIDRTDVKVSLQGFKDGLDPSDNVIELPDLLLAIAFETCLDEILALAIAS